MSKYNECKLTTVDNPFDPFTQFDDWFRFDTEKGYNSCSRLMRIAELSEDFSQKEKEEELERAIDEIVFYDPIGLYKKVTREVPDDDTDED